MTSNHSIGLLECRSFAPTGEVFGIIAGTVADSESDDAVPLEHCPAYAELSASSKYLARKLKRVPALRVHGPIETERNALPCSREAAEAERRLD